jgi:hypothetical protein
LRVRSHLNPLKASNFELWLNYKKRHPYFKLWQFVRVKPLRERVRIVNTKFWWGNIQKDFSRFPIFRTQNFIRKSINLNVKCQINKQISTNSYFKLVKSTEVWGRIKTGHRPIFLSLEIQLQPPSFSMEMEKFDS